MTKSSRPTCRTWCRTRLLNPRRSKIGLKPRSIALRKSMLRKKPSGHQSAKVMRKLSKFFRLRLEILRRGRVKSKKPSRL